MKCVERRFYRKEEPFGHYNYYLKNPNIEDDTLKTTKCIHLLYSVSYKILSLVMNPPQTNLSTYENVQFKVDE